MKISELKRSLSSQFSLINIKTIQNKVKECELESIYKIEEINTSLVVKMKVRRVYDDKREDVEKNSNTDFKSFTWIAEVHVTPQNSNVVGIVNNFFRNLKTEYIEADNEGRIFANVVINGDIMAYS